MAAVALLLAGCGDDGAPPPPDGVVFTQTATFDAAGGAIDSGSYGASVSAAPGTFVRSAPVTLSVHAQQFPEVEQRGYAYTTKGVRLTLEPDAIAGGAGLTLEVPLAGAYGAFRSLLAVETQAGTFWVLPSTSAGSGRIRGVLEQSILQAMFALDDPDAPHTLNVYSANRLLLTSQEPFTSSVRPFVAGQFAGQVPDLAGKRVAVLVHGIEADLADLVQLGQYVAGYTRSGQSAPFYDVVIGFEYSSNRPLAIIGSAMAEAMQAVGLQDAALVDVIAHSMGNPVSRYAMETISLPNRISGVRAYISLGGPQAGIPFGEFMHTEQAFFYIFRPEAEPCLLDLITDGKNGPPQTDFFTNLNLGSDQMGPNFDTAHYFTMSGDNYLAEEPPLGLSVHLLYLAAVGLDEEDDGLVADYSAQSPVLERQSATWSPNAPFDLSHSQLHTAPQALNQIGAWLDSVP
jgi:hypothetical protein